MSIGILINLSKNCILIPAQSEFTCQRLKHLGLACKFLAGRSAFLGSSGVCLDYAGDLIHALRNLLNGICLELCRLGDLAYQLHRILCTFHSGHKGFRRAVRNLCSVLHCLQGA